MAGCEVIDPSPGYARICARACADYERNGVVSDVDFSAATEPCADGLRDVINGAAERVIAAARVALPSRLPTRSIDSLAGAGCM